MRYSMQADTASRARRVATRRPMPQGGPCAARKCSRARAPDKEPPEGQFVNYR
jgi:hypothetical protein